MYLLLSLDIERTVYSNEKHHLSIENSLPTVNIRRSYSHLHWYIKNSKIKFNNILLTRHDKLEKLVPRNEDLRIRPFGRGYGRFRTSHQRYGIESELNV